MLPSFFSYFQTIHSSIFLISALFGTTLFFLRVLSIFLLGGLGEEGSDQDFSDSFDTEPHEHTGGSFKLFTLHSLSGFFMIWGFAGLACTEQYLFSLEKSFLIATFFGLCMLFLTAAIMSYALLLQSSGSVFSNTQTIGLVATVCQRIPQHGFGKIQVIVHGASREMLARSHHQKNIESFTLVKISKVIDTESVEVEPLIP